MVCLKWSLGSLFSKLDAILEQENYNLLDFYHTKKGMNIPANMSSFFLQLTSTTVAWIICFTIICTFSSIMVCISFHADCVVLQVDCLFVRTSICVLICLVNSLVCRLVGKRLQHYFDYVNGMLTQSEHEFC